MRVPNNDMKCLVVSLLATALLATATAAAEKSVAKGPTMVAPNAKAAASRVNRRSESAAPPLVLPVSRQVTETSPSDAGASAEVSVLAAPTEGEAAVEVQVDAEMVTPPSPTEAKVARTVYEPMCREVPVSNHIMHIGARRFARCRQMVPVHVQVKNPSDCCCYTVCVKVPACCEGDPHVSSRRGILGRGIVEVCWDCGWTAKVVFRARGDVVVHYMAG